MDYEIGSESQVIKGEETPTTPKVAQTPEERAASAAALQVMIFEIQNWPASNFFVEIHNDRKDLGEYQEKNILKLDNPLRDKLVVRFQYSFL